MRSIFLGLCAAAAICVLPSQPARAGHFTELAAVTCEYADAAELFHRSLCRCRRSTDYAERLADRLACAAGDLRDAVRVGADPRRIAVMYDEVYILHTRLNELLGSGCRRPDPIVLAYWRPLDRAFERLVYAIEGCQPVCPLISHRRQVVSRPPVIFGQGGFGGGFFGELQAPRNHHDLDRFDQSFGAQRDFGRPFGSGFGHQRPQDRFPSQLDRRRGSELQRQLDGNQLGRSGHDFFQRGRSGDFRRAPEPRELQSAAVRSILSRLFD